MHIRRLTLAFATLALVAAACASDDDQAGTTTGGTTGTTGGGTVNVTLQEWAVIPAPATIAAGSVTFSATNNGPADPHELVVFRTDLGPRALPTKADGSVDESGAGVTLLDEIEEFPVGETKTMTLNLEAGSYALICNLVEQEGGAAEVHYQLGMSAQLTVT